MSRTQAHQASNNYVGLCVFYAAVIGSWGHYGGDLYLQQLAWLLFIPHAVLGASAWILLRSKC